MQTSYKEQRVELTETRQGTVSWRKLFLLYSLPGPSPICNYKMIITQAAQLYCLWLWSEGFRVLCHWSLLPELSPLVLLTKALKVKWTDCSSQLLKEHIPLLSMNPMIPTIALDPNNIPQLEEPTAILQLQGLNTIHSRNTLLQTVIVNYKNILCIAAGRYLRKERSSFLMGSQPCCCGQKAEIHLRACGIRLKKSQ